jgi:hypothetical protein
MKTLKKHINLVLVIIEMSLLPFIGFSQTEQKDSLNHTNNLILEALSTQLNLSPQQIEKINLIYLESMDSSPISITDFESNLQKILTKEQKKKLKVFLNSGSTRHSLKYSIKQ